MANATLPAKVEGKPNPIGTIRDLIQKNKANIEAALPKDMTVQTLMRLAATVLQQSPSLMECAPVTVIGAIIKARELDLSLNPAARQAALIPYWNNRKNRFEAHFQPMYGGLMNLAWRSDKIGPIYAETVYEGDGFEYNLGVPKKLTHTRTKESGRGKITHFYAVAEWLTGQVQFVVFPVEDIEAIRDRYSRAYGKDGAKSIWGTNFKEMGEKTAIIRLCKDLPLSTKNQEVVGLAEKADTGIPQDLGILVDDSEKASEPAAAEAPKSLESLAQDAEKQTKAKKVESH